MAAEMNWAFQSTGFTAGGNPAAQTAIAMRDGQIWPVVFSETGNMLQAYSLYPVTNPNISPATNWFQIGSNLIQDPGSVSMLSAATSSDGRFGAVLRKIGSPNSTAIIGSSPNGFLAPMAGVQAIDFDSQGNLLKATTGLIPTSTVGGVGALVDIAATPWGDTGIVDANLKYYQKISMAGGIWGFTDLGQIRKTSYINDSIDLAIDSVGRPHVVAVMTENNSSLVSFDFDVHTGQWSTLTLDTGMSPMGATLAADARGGVGAAWVAKDIANPSAAPTLMYAYNDGNEWTIQTVATGVTEVVGQPVLLAPMQGVGLAYDAENLPVISFTAGNGKIWVAYDPTSPIAAVPEPSTLILFAMGAMLVLVKVGKSRKNRQ
jgi:hypothetical protein